MSHVWALSCPSQSTSVVSTHFWPRGVTSVAVLLQLGIQTSANNMWRQLCTCAPQCGRTHAERSRINDAHVEQDMLLNVSSKVKVCTCVLAASRKWHMSGHMFQPPGGQALCSSCSLHLSQILYPSLCLSLSFSLLSLSVSPWGFKQGCLIQSDISHGPLMGLLV